MKFRVLEYTTVSSTNDVAIDLARRGASEGLVVRSDYQTRGRGRGKRRWYCPKGKGLLMTMLLRPRSAVIKWADLTLIGCRAVAEALSGWLKNVSLKLPNDILASGRKIGGVLVEGSARGREQIWACVGVGVNVNTRRQKVYRGGTSILIEKGTNVDLNALMSRIIEVISQKCAK